MELNENAINFGLPYSLNGMAQVTDPKHKQPLVGGEETTNNYDEWQNMAQQLIN